METVVDSYPLNRRRKAAMIVHMLLSQGGTLALQDMPETLQEKLAGEIAGLRRLDRAAMASVVAEFAAELDAIGMTGPADSAGALATLSGHLSPDLARRLQAQIADAQNGDPWPRIAVLPVAVIGRIMTAESTEIGAIALSKLPVAKAAEVLGTIPGERARRVTYAMSLTASVAPDTVRRIGAALLHDYGRTPVSAFEKAPVQRVGAILNAAPPDTRDAMLAGLGADDAAFASDVRRAIFTFKDIAIRVRGVDIPAAIRGVDGTVLATAIAAAGAGDAAVAASGEHILQNLSQRMAAQIREDAADRDPPSQTEANAAMAALTSAIRALVDAGSITLLDPPDEMPG